MQSNDYLIKVFNILYENLETCILSKIVTDFYKKSEGLYAMCSNACRPYVTYDCMAVNYSVSDIDPDWYFHYMLFLYNSLLYSDNSEPYFSLIYPLRSNYMTLSDNCEEIEYNTTLKIIYNFNSKVSQKVIDYVLEHKELTSRLLITPELAQSIGEHIYMAHIKTTSNKALCGTMFHGCTSVYDVYDVYDKLVNYKP